MSLLCIDPGSEKSGWCLLTDGGAVLDHGWEWNWLVRDKIPFEFGSDQTTKLLIEDVSHYGMPVGKEVFDTVKWMGRFDSAAQPGSAIYIPRPEIKVALCNSVQATDANVRQAVIDHYGGDSVAVGGKKCTECKGQGWRGRGRATCQDCHCLNNGDPKVTAGCGYETHPGPLHGVSGHVWSALALGIAYLKREAGI